MELKIKFGKKFEVERIKQTFAKIDWYKEHGYKPKIPSLNNYREVCKKSKLLYSEKEIMNYSEPI